jgi:hypothetical protein
MNSVVNRRDWGGTMGAVQTKSGRSDRPVRKLEPIGPCNDVSLVWWHQRSCRSGDGAALAELMRLVELHNVLIEMHNHCRVPDERAELKAEIVEVRASVCAISDSWESVVERRRQRVAQ